MHNQIAADINYAESETLYVGHDGSSFNTSQFVKLVLKRKAGYVVVEATGVDYNESTVNQASLVLPTIPDGFLPVNNYAVITIPAVSNSWGRSCYYFALLVSASGELKVINGGNRLDVIDGASSSEAQEFFYDTHYSGWETTV